MDGSPCERQTGTKRAAQKERHERLRHKRLRLSMNVSPPLKNLGPPPPPPCLSTCHKPQYCLGTRPSTGGGTCLATLKLAGATSMFRVSHSSMGRPRRAGERASKVMFAKNQSVLRFIDILPSKVSLGYGARAEKRPDFFCVWGGSLPLSGYFAFGLNTPLPPPFMIKPRICLDFSRVAGGTTPPSKKN